MKYCSLLLAGFLLACSSPLMAADTRDDFPSCYQTLGSDAPQQAAPERALFIVIDETVDANEQIRQSVIEKALRFIRPGDMLEVVRFAAYTGEHYTRLMLKGRIDHRLSEEQRYSISKRALNGFDHCFQRQAAYVKSHLARAISDSFGDSETDIPKTELAGSLASLSKLVRDSEADHKVVLLFSDMLENSDITSFYQNGNVRDIHPKKELEKLEQSGINGQWDNASVYVIGAGLIAHNKKAYRSERTMNQLKAFWSGYFQRGNAHIEGWGAPMLLEDLR